MFNSPQKVETYKRRTPLQDLTPRANKKADNKETPIKMKGGKTHLEKGQLVYIYFYKR